MQNSLLICPVCRSPLVETVGGVACAAGHRFDRAAKGYTNLLLGSRARHGDDGEMVSARRRFLDSGAYAPIAEAISGLLDKFVEQRGVVLDAGCGEGYYTGFLAERHPDRRFFGIDVSKEAIRAASSRLSLRRRGVSLFVAGVYALPFADECFDAILSILSPFAGQEFCRTLKKQGLLVSVIPGARHLWELKSVLYDTPYENNIADYALDGFDFLEKIELHNRILLKTPDQIHDLFAMTPYYHRTPRQGHERLSSLGSLETETSFELLVYRRL